MSNSDEYHVEESVLYRVEGMVGIITLNRPDRLNAIDYHTESLLMQTLVKADRDPANRAIVITGAGKGFCSGGDVKMMKSPNDNVWERPGRKAVITSARDLVDTIVRMEKPTIAMVNGVAAGLGATLALLTDVVIMADTARIGDRHVNVGLVAGDGGAVIWPLLIGVARAKQYLMTGRMIAGPQAAKMGLVADSVPLEELEATVMELANELASLPPYAVQATKASVNKIVQDVSGLVLDACLTYEALSLTMDDHREAVAAFAEKRPGVYTGN